MGNYMPSFNPSQIVRSTTSSTAWMKRFTPTPRGGTYVSKSSTTYIMGGGSSGFNWGGLAMGLFSLPLMIMSFIPMFRGLRGNSMMQPQMQQQQQQPAVDNNLNNLKTLFKDMDWVADGDGIYTGRDKDGVLHSGTYEQLKAELNKGASKAQLEQQNPGQQQEADDITRQKQAAAAGGQEGEVEAPGPSVKGNAPVAPKGKTKGNTNANGKGPLVENSSNEAKGPKAIEWQFHEDPKFGTGDAHIVSGKDTCVIVANDGDYLNLNRFEVKSNGDDKSIRNISKWPVKRLKIIESDVTKKVNKELVLTQDSQGYMYVALKGKTYVRLEDFLSYGADGAKKYIKNSAGVFKSIDEIESKKVAEEPKINLPTAKSAKAAKA